MSISQAVIDRDHELEGAATRSSEQLAEHRWHQCLDPDGPGHELADYARAIGRSKQTVSNYAHGWRLMNERAADPVKPGLTVTDAVRLAGQSTEQQAFTEAIADGSGQSVANVARGDNTRRREIIAQAQERSERRGTDPVEEARDIAARSRQTAEQSKRQRAEKRQRSSMVFVRIEGHLAAANRRLKAALQEAEDANLPGEEMELLRESIRQNHELLRLLDVRFGGESGIDWDAELAAMGGSS